jgi:multicomponent Na+:H+ antiporter subunit D
VGTARLAMAMAQSMAEGAVSGVPWAALAVALPLAASLLATLSGRFARALAPVVGLGTIAVALGASLHVMRHGPQLLAVGGWGAPLGIVLRLDGLGCAFLLTGALVAAAAFVSAWPQWQPGDPRTARRAWAFWPLVYALLAGINGVFTSADLFNLYVGLELVTVAAVALVALDGTAAALAAALRYLLFAVAGSLAYLLGVVLVYAQFGTLDLALLGAAIAGGSALPWLPAGLLAGGLMIKAALFPFQAWLPAAHASAPAAASALLSALVVKAPFLVLLRLAGEALGPLGAGALVQLLGAFGAAAVVLGSWMALRQQRLKLLVAYSTVAQLGYLLLLFPLALGAAEGDWRAFAWSGVVIHALAHALAKGAMFLAAGVMAQALGHDRIDGLGGLGQAIPMAAFAFGIAAVSLMGLPPSGGFLAKYLLLTSALASGQWWWVVLVLAGGLMAALYLFRPLSCLLAAGHPALPAAVPRAPQFAALALALGAVALGLLSAGPFQLLQSGRPSLLGAGG